MNQEFSDYCNLKLGNDFSYEDALSLRSEYEGKLKEHSEGFRKTMLGKADSFLASLSKRKESKCQFEINYTPRGIWERYALHRIKSNSKVGLASVIFLSLLYIFIIPLPEEGGYIQAIFVMIAILSVIQYFETNAIRRILTTLNHKSEPDDTDNPVNPPEKSKNQLDD